MGGTSGGGISPIKGETLTSNPKELKTFQGNPTKKVEEILTDGAD